MTFPIQFFKKIFSVLMSFFFMLMGGNAEKVDVQITDPVTDRSTEITYEVTNYTGVTLCADKYFRIEKQTDDGWEALPFNEDFATPDIAIILHNCQSVRLTIDLQNAYGHSLQAGTYRLVLAYCPTPCVFAVMQTPG